MKPHRDYHNHGTAPGVDMKEILCVRLDLLAEHLERGVIVGLVGDLADDVAEYYAAVFVKDEDGTCEQSCERAVYKLQSVFLTEKR